MLLGKKRSGLGELAGPELLLLGGLDGEESNDDGTLNGELNNKDDFVGLAYEAVGREGDVDAGLGLATDLGLILAVPMALDRVNGRVLDDLNINHVSKILVPKTQQQYILVFLNCFQRRCRVSQLRKVSGSF